MCTIGGERACCANGYHQCAESPQFVKDCKTAGCFPVCRANLSIGRTLPVTPFQILPADGRNGFAPAGAARTSSANAQMMDRLASKSHRATGEDFADQLLRAVLIPAA